MHALKHHKKVSCSASKLEGHKYGIVSVGSPLAQLTVDLSCGIIKRVGFKITIAVDCFSAGGM